MSLNEDDISFEPESPLLNSSKEDEPIIYSNDRFNIAYIIFYIFGVTSVLPWNMFITANKYYFVKFQNTSHEDKLCESSINSDIDKTYMQDSFENYFAIAAMVPQVIALMLSTAFQHLITMNTRMHLTLGGICIMFIVTTALTLVDTHTWQEEFFVLTLVTVVIVNSLAAVFAGSVFGLGGVFPPRFTQALMAGQGLGGVFPSCISILTTAVSSNHCVSAFIYFSLAVVAVITAYIAYRVLIKLNFADTYLNQSDLMHNDDAHFKELSSSSWESKVTAKPPFYDILLKILNPAILVMLIFMVTLGCFPGVVSNIESTDSPENSQWNDVYFTAVVCFLLFNIVDWAGRSLAGVKQWPKENSPRILTLLVVLRASFIPLFMLCNIQPRSLPLVFDHDVYPILFMILFAISNGYLGSLCMMYAPSKVQPDYRETAGNMMALFLSFGLAFGALLSFGIKQLI